MSITSRSVPLLLAVALLAPALAHAQPAGHFEFALIGDAPYAPVAGGQQVYPSPPYDRLIADINRHRKLAFVVHAGDIKAGNTLCTDTVFDENVKYFNKFEIPAVYVPGDNEWTDCHRANNGGYDPIERLATLRQKFYPDTMSLGATRIPLERQAGYPENQRWRVGDVVFVGINMPGSNNNRDRRTGLFQDLDAEYDARNAANLAWLTSSFALARGDAGVRGILITIQANPFERFLEAGQEYQVSGFADFVATLRAETLAYGKPVVLVHGDTHYFRIDRPMTGTYPACTGPNLSRAESCGSPVPVPGSPTDRIHNFVRLEVFAQNDFHWVKVTVDPGDPNVFSFSPQRVPGN
jgi:hypothetical protein